MINNVTDYKDIIPLWQEAFGDSEEEINYFLDNANYSCIGLYDGNELAAMLFLFKCRLGGEDNNYIYAASTYKKYRSKGYMTELLDYCKNRYNALCLLPADEMLIKYYYDRGFVNEADTDSLKFFEKEDIKDWLFEGCNLAKPKVFYYKR